MEKEFVNIVSGLPRSGTSMMMKMLEAGGIPALVDDQRAADVDNPNGYYEFEPVKKTKNDPTWVLRARRKCVKMVYRLLYDLPAEHHYRVVFMQRNLDEVIASQNVMLERIGQTATREDDEKIKSLFLDQLQQVAVWLAAQPNFETLEVDYNALLEDPLPQLGALNSFLGNELDMGAMAQVVDQRLYRHRRSPE